MATDPILAAFEVTVVERHSWARPSVLADYWALTKPEINFLIALATAAAFCLACPQTLAAFPWALFLRTVFGTVLVASGAGTLNQLIERRFDSEMRRTARRPIAAGRIEPIPALVFGIVLSLAGVLYLGVTVRLAPSVLALLTLCGYLFLYTPLKRRTSMCTLIGAIPGAMPVLIGYVAVAGKLEARAWLLYAILFLWQFPHFMAIAWMYREDYARAGFKVLPRGSEKDQFVGWQSILPTLALVSIAWVPMALRHTHPVLGFGTLSLSLGFLYFAAYFALVRSNESARRLLLVSILYLPLVFLLQVLARV
jgi:protoheme IX farnesyltransferase